MCEFCGKLIAWLDRELAVDEALEVELHLGACSECRRQLGVYEQMSDAVDAYCDAAMESSAPQTELRLRPVLLGAGAVAAVLALLLASPRVHRTEPPTRATIAATSAPVSPVVAETPRSELNSAMPNPKRRVSDPSSAGTKGMRDSSTKDAPRFTGNVLRERNDNALNARATSAAAGWQSAEPAIQIAIPADAVLPPGAAPEGVSFVAEVSIAPDGSAHRIFLQP